MISDNVLQVFHSFRYRELVGVIFHIPMGYRYPELCPHLCTRNCSVTGGLFIVYIVCQWYTNIRYTFSPSCIYHCVAHSVGIHVPVYAFL